MRSFRLPRFPAIAIIAAGTFLSVQTPAWALLDFIFGKKDKEAPTADQRVVQEQAASQALAQAAQWHNQGKSSRARSAYKQIVKQYPFTQAASEASFQSAVLLRYEDGDLEDCFDALQSFIDNYRQSPRFNDAVQKQYEIAEEAKGGKKQRGFLLLPLKMNTSDILAFYEKIIVNAPFGKYAALAQFSIAEIQQDMRRRTRPSPPTRRSWTIIRPHPRPRRRSSASLPSATWPLSAVRTLPISSPRVTRCALT
jgi:hypothetical protein